MFCLLAVGSEVVQIKKLQERTLDTWLQLWSVKQKGTSDPVNVDCHTTFLMGSLLEFSCGRQLKQHRSLRRNYSMMQSAAMYTKVFDVTCSTEFPDFNASLILKALTNSSLFHSDQWNLTSVTTWAEDMMDSLSFGRTDVTKVSYEFIS